MTKPPKPILLHLQGLAVCALLFGLAFGWSWFFPLSTLHFVRITPDRVDCHIEQHRLVVICFEVIDVEGVQEASNTSAANNKTGKGSSVASHLLHLTDTDGNDTSVPCSEFADQTVKQINEFIEDSNQHELQTWTMSLFGYATFLIVIIAAFFTVAVTCDWIVNRFRWLTYVPEPFVVEDKATS
jgi:hypothetical protein